MPHIHPATGLRHAGNFMNDGIIVVIIFQVNAQNPLQVITDYIEIFDLANILQYFGNGDLHIG